MKKRAVESGRTMLIGEVAELTGVSRKGIRHYESLGLLPGVRRRGAYRIYCRKDTVVIRLIKHAQSMGFSLAEIQTFVHCLYEQPGQASSQARDLLEAKWHHLDDQLAALRSCMTEIRRLECALEDTLAELLTPSS